MIQLSDSRQNKAKVSYYFIWLVALSATGGSLFFSEVMKLPPCVLCWYQRIAIYPLALLIPLAIISDELVIFSKYIFTLVTVGLLISIYHNLLYYGVIPESIAPCKEGISCTSRQIEWLGFITIPLLSLLAFSIVFVVLTITHFRRPQI